MLEVAKTPTKAFRAGACVISVSCSACLPFLRVQSADGLPDDGRVRAISIETDHYFCSCASIRRSAEHAAPAQSCICYAPLDLPLREPRTRRPGATSFRAAEPLVFGGF